MWRILEIVPSEHLDVVKVGLDAMRNTYLRLDIPTDAYIEAYKIYSEGHRDYIDALYYSTAKISGIPWLTTDLEFIEFLRRCNHAIDGVVYTPGELGKILKKR